MNPSFPLRLLKLLDLNSEESQVTVVIFIVQKQLI